MTCLRVLAVALALATHCGSSAACRADLIFEIRQGGVADTAFEVGIGQQISLTFYLKETGDETRLSTYGLRSSYLGLQYAKGAGNASIDSATTGGDFVPISTATDYGWEVGSSYFSTTPPKGSSLELATVTFQAAAPGNVTTFQIVEPSDVANDLVLNDPPSSTSLDSVVFAGSPTTFTITTAVPEPSHVVVLLLGVAAAGGVHLLRQRRRQGPA